MALAIVAVMVIAAACDSKPVMAHSRFVDMPSAGWQQSMPLTFEPQYDDSAASYTLKLAIRHDNSYRYRNLSLVVDIIDADSTVNREKLNIDMADNYGNWTGGGFGSLYQKQVTLTAAATPQRARWVVVWQAMKGCDTLHGLENIGLFVIPN